MTQEEYIDFENLLISSQLANQLQGADNQSNIIRPQLGDEFGQQAVAQNVAFFTYNKPSTLKK